MSSVAIAVPVNRFPVPKAECMIPVGAMRTVKYLAPTLASCLTELDHSGFAAWTLALSDGGRIVLGRVEAEMAESPPLHPAAAALDTVGGSRLAWCCDSRRSCDTW